MPPHQWQHRRALLVVNSDAAELNSLHRVARAKASIKKAAKARVREAQNRRHERDHGGCGRALECDRKHCRGDGRQCCTACHHAASGTERRHAAGERPEIRLAIQPAVLQKKRGLPKRISLKGRKVSLTLYIQVRLTGCSTRFAGSLASPPGSD